jgi:hypothetical protein
MTLANVPLTREGSVRAADASLAADAVSGRNYQAVKLYDPTLDVAAPIGVAANPLVTAIPYFVDAFQRVSVAQPATLFDSQFQYDLQPLLWEQITAVNGWITHLPYQCCALLSTTGQAGSSAALQTRQYFRYQPGKAQNVFATFVLGAAAAFVTRRVGYFDASNGIFLEQAGTTDVAIVRRTNVTGTPADNRVVQADWNLDTLDGSGPSGITIDLAKAQILVIDLQFLGVGRVRIGFDIDGLVVWAHEFLNANNLASVYMTTANLPVRYEQTAAAGAGPAAMDAICAAVISSGGFDDERGFLSSIGNAASVTAGSGTRTCLVALRPAAQFAGIVNRTTIVPLDVSVLAGANPILVEVVYAPIVTGGAWSAVSEYSAVEANRTATGIAGGTVLASYHIGASGVQTKTAAAANIVSRLPLVLDYAGANPRGLALCATGIGGTSASYGAISWKELR